MLGENLKAFREACGCTQQEAADFLGILREQISYFETGQRVPSAPQLLQLCDYYGVDLEECYTDSPGERGKAMVFAFRKDSFTPEDRESLASFRKIIKNFIKLKRIAAEHGL